MNYTLRFNQDKIKGLAQRYVEENSDQMVEDRIVEIIGPSAMRSGFYTKSDFVALCHWKSPRTRPRCEQNDELFIHEVTSIALKTENERLRIEILTLLDGVAWPTASVLLHFASRDRYPILDFRALESLSIPLPQVYDFPFWCDYVQICRQIATEANVDMRTLDRALWQYSKDNPVS